MESRYADADAARMVGELSTRALPNGQPVGETLALRTYTARLLGAEPSLVLHGGGNTSAKGQATTLLGEKIDVLYIKGSGWDLATIEPPGHPAVRLAPLLDYRRLAAMSDEDMVNELRLNLIDASAPTPSVETLLHAYLPAQFIDHTHADAVLSLADQPDGESVCREVFGDSTVWVPYVMPGFALAKRCAEAYEAAAKGAKKAPSVIILQQHGIFTLGATAKESYGRMIDAVTKAEMAIHDRSRTVSMPAASHDVTRANARAELVLPRLRGALASAAGEKAERGVIFEVRTSEVLRAFLARPDAKELTQIGCATPDHVIRTKPVPLHLPALNLEEPEKLHAFLETEIRAYAKEYDAYFERMCKTKKVTRTKLDPWPRVVLIPEIGICAIGQTRKDASIVADVYEHTIDVIMNASGIGTYQPVSRADLFDVEYWSLEQAKIKKTAPAPLAGRIALVTGAASGIGKATAKRLLELGAHVTLVDREAVELEVAHAELSRGRAWQVALADADVTSAEDVERAVGVAVRAFGGLDLVVSNAGTAPEGRLETREGEAALRSSLEVNLLGHNHVARASAAVMTAQGRGGCILFNASKSAFNQGPGFGPYAVAKTALVALMRQYAVDLGPQGIRANAVNADRVRTALFGGGVLESRAKARGLSIEDYFRSNLLKREVTSEHVAEAFAYLASAEATTGCIITVDGGNAAAFPR